MDRRIIFSALLLCVLALGCGGDTPSGLTTDSSKAAVSTGPAADDGASSQAGAAAGQVNMDLSGLQKEYARLTGGSFASTVNVIYYPSLKEYSNCGEDQLHALLAGQSIVPETANPCGAPPSHFLLMRARGDSLDFLHKSQQAETVGGNTVFHFEKGQQVIVKPNSEKQQNIVRYHALRVQAPK